jgi:L-2,4-diaminobutyric acid acetyltransferase
VNSAYAYFLVCDHFRTTSVIAENADGQVLGAVTAYVKPEDPDTLFVWQVAVHAYARGQGLGKRMLSKIAGRPAASRCSRLETTISPSNTASRRLFTSWAESRGCSVEETSYLEAADFGAGAGEDAHEAECLFRMYPLHALPQGDPE